MALKHAHPLEVIELFPDGETPSGAVSTSLLRTPRVQLLRLVLAAGHGLPAHHVAAEITIQCLAGQVDVTADERLCPLAAGQLVVLPGGQQHAVQAREDAVVLVTLLHE
ncbi:hypothetical protein BER2_3777 [plant metagenome]|uniref:Cupin type-2 domain-containing protein n=1 Tax=plant metagenome TaxID=1297885 RepID=A0A484Q729_9ZZZZ